MKRKIKIATLILCFCVCFAAFAACGSAIEQHTGDRTKLDKPIGLRVYRDENTDEYILIWGKVNGASKYAVDLDGEVRETTKNIFTLPRFDRSQTLEIKVKCLGDGIKYDDSDWVSYSYKYVKQEVATAALKYELLPDRSGYEVSRKNKGLNTGLEGRVVIPDYYNGLPVKRIAERGFALTEDELMRMGGANPTTGSGCNSVTTSIKLPSGLQSIGNGAFKNLIELTEINVPESVTRIEEEAFYRCIKLADTSIPANLVELGKEAYSFTAISKAVVPDGITKLDSVFTGCDSLVDVLIPDSVTDLEGAFSYCDGLEKITLPQGVTNLKSTFSGCVNLKEITLPQGVTNLKSTFSGCVNLKEITVPNGVTELPNTFRGCESLTEVFVPDGVTDLNATFFGCTSLEKVTGLKGVKKIDMAFSGCGRLKEIELPPSLTLLEKRAFENCVALKTMSVPQGVNEIGRQVFDGCTGLTSVNIPDSVETIGDKAFNGCTGLTGISIPDSVETIGDKAFNGCVDLADIRFSENIKSVGAEAFADTAWYKALPDGIVMISGRVLYKIKNGSVESLDEQDFEGVDHVVAGAFSDCIALRSVCIPKKFPLSNNMFSDMQSLEYIRFYNFRQSNSPAIASHCPKLKTVEIVCDSDNLENGFIASCDSFTTYIISGEVDTFMANKISRSAKKVVLPFAVKKVDYSFSPVSSYPCLEYDILYSGTAEQWGKIEKIGYDSFSAKMQMYFYSETEPDLNEDGTDYNGKYWHYRDGEPTVWEFKAA